MILRTPLDLGSAIRDRRQKLNLDQDSLARLIGVSRKWIVEVEKGKPRAEIGLVLRTLEALGLKLWLKTDQPDGDVAMATGSSVPAKGSIDKVLDRARKKGR